MSMAVWFDSSDCLAIVPTYCRYIPTYFSAFLSRGSLFEYLFLLCCQRRFRPIIQRRHSFLFRNMPLSIHAMHLGYIRPNWVSNPGFAGIRIRSLGISHDCLPSTGRYKLGSPSIIRLFLILAEAVSIRIPYVR